MAQEHVAALIEIAGGQVSLAYKMGVTQQSVSRWKRNGVIPQDRVGAALAAAAALRPRLGGPAKRLPAPGELNPALAPALAPAMTPDDPAFLADLI